MWVRNRATGFLKFPLVQNFGIFLYPYTYNFTSLSKSVSRLLCLGPCSCYTLSESGYSFSSHQHSLVTSVWTFQELHFSLMLEIDVKHFKATTASCLIFCLVQCRESFLSGSTVRRGLSLTIYIKINAFLYKWSLWSSVLLRKGYLYTRRAYDQFPGSLVLKSGPPVPGPGPKRLAKFPGLKVCFWPKSF